MGAFSNRHLAKRTQNGGRHRCRPPVAGLRPAWRPRGDTCAFWFRRHAPPAPRTALGFAFRSPGPGAIPFRASTPRSPAASSTVRPKPDNRALATISGSPSTRCRAARLQPSRPTPFPCRGDGRERLEHPSLPVRQAFALATAGLPARSDIPPEHERFPCGTCSEFRHKLLMFLRFLASASSAYSHDAVIESESCKGSNDTAKLWITWISWRRFPGLRCMNGPLFPVHATSGTKEALRP